MASETEGELDAEVLEDDDLEDLSDDALLEVDALDDVEVGEDELAEVELEVDGLEDEVGVVVDDVAIVEGEEGLVDDEDDLDDDEVEASLDVILKERLVVVDDEDEDEDTEAADAEDRADGTLRVLPKQPGEFVCQSCFLVKSDTQLADRKRSLCRDCV